MKSARRPLALGFREPDYSHNRCVRTDGSARTVVASTVCRQRKIPENYGGKVVVLATTIRPPSIIHSNALGVRRFSVRKTLVRNLTVSRLRFAYAANNNNNNNMYINILFMRVHAINKASCRTNRTIQTKVRGCLRGLCGVRAYGIIFRRN